MKQKITTKGNKIWLVEINDNRHFKFVVLMRELVEDLG
jgi:hypothetical protein